MAGNKMADLVSKVSTNKTSKAKEYAHASEWPQCTVAGCPLPTTIKDDKQTCGYHHREHGFNAECITEAIKENHMFIKKYNEMIYWNVRTWNERAPQIMGWPVLPATELEMQLPTLYLNRLKKFIDEAIKERAEAIYQGH
jgi:hypothetical protein